MPDEENVTSRMTLDEIYLLKSKLKQENKIAAELTVELTVGAVAVRLSFTRRIPWSSTFN